MDKDQVAFEPTSLISSISRARTPWRDTTEVRGSGQDGS
jgi:hypothetical protein